MDDLGDVGRVGDGDGILNKVGKLLEGGLMLRSDDENDNDEYIQYDDIMADYELLTTYVD